MIERGAFHDLAVQITKDEAALIHTFKDAKFPEDQFRLHGIIGKVSEEWFHSISVDEITGAVLFDLTQQNTDKVQKLHWERLAGSKQQTPW